jgi:hypothetical protein
MKIKPNATYSRGNRIGIPSVMKPVKVSVRTVDGSVIQGNINLKFENRVSDLFIDSSTPFIVLFDAMIPGEGLDKVLILNKSHIVWVEPEDDTPIHSELAEDT